jgi:hypothetical protein
LKNSFSAENEFFNEIGRNLTFGTRREALLPTLAVSKPRWW